MSAGHAVFPPPADEHSKALGPIVHYTGSSTWIIQHHKCKALLRLICSSVSSTKAHRRPL